MTIGLNLQLELCAIVAEFGVEALAIERFESGFGGKKWTINCRDNHMFVLKRHERRGFDAARIESARVFVSALEQARIAPIAMATSLRTTYCERESGLYSLATFVTGRSHDRSNLALRASAVALAHMHHLGREHAADAPLRKVRSFDALEFLDVHMKALASRTNASMVSVGVCLAEARQTLHRYESGVVVGPVHGDFHAGNVILQDNGRIVIVDFDSVHFSERAYDVAIAMESFMRDSANPQRLSAFAIEYHRACGALGLTYEEWMALPALIIRRIATILWLTLESSRLTDVTRVMTKLDVYTAYARQWRSFPAPCNLR